MTDAELDRQFAALPAIAPPRELQARILTEVGVPAARIANVVGSPALRVVAAGSTAPSPDRDSTAPSAPERRPLRRLWIGGLVAAMAAGLLLGLPAATPERGDPSTFVPRGSDAVHPQIELRAAVSHAGSIERLVEGRSYAAGDTVHFRVSSSAPMELTLRRDGQILFEGEIPAGDSDLPVGYRLEPGEIAADFVVEADGVTSTVRIGGVAR